MACVFVCVSVCVCAWRVRGPVYVGWVGGGGDECVRANVYVVVCGSVVCCCVCGRVCVRVGVRLSGWTPRGLPRDTQGGGLGDCLVICFWQKLEFIQS